MSGLGLLATAFGSYASTLGGLYKEQVEKEQAAQEKLAAEERQREWERQKTAEKRMFAIDMLQRKFEQDVQLMDMENEWKAKNADSEHQRALERIGYEHKLRLEEQESALRNKQSLIDYAAQAARRDALAKRMIEQGGGTEINPENTKLVVDALIRQLSITGEMIESARPEEKQIWIDKYQAIQQTLNNYLRLGNAGGTPFRDPNDIVNWLANE